MKIKIIILLLINITIAKAQNIDNNVLGEFINTDSTNLYSKFVFDNNGKTNIADNVNCDFYKKEDTLIIIPDKEALIFKIENNTLIGILNNIKNSIWKKSNENINDNRENDTIAKKNATLLYEYFIKIRVNLNEMVILIDANKKKKLYALMNDLCNRGLIRACKDNFGYQLVEDLGGIKAVFNPKIAKPLKKNPKMITLANNLIKLDAVEGHTMLAQ